MRQPSDNVLFFVLYFTLHVSHEVELVLLYGCVYKKIAIALHRTLNASYTFGWVVRVSEE